MTLTFANGLAGSGEVGNDEPLSHPTVASEQTMIAKAARMTRFLSCRFA